jgi:chromosome segregation ATPase
MVNFNNVANRIDKRIKKIRESDEYLKADEKLKPFFIIKDKGLAELAQEYKKSLLKPEHGKSKPVTTCEFAIFSLFNVDKDALERKLGLEKNGWKVVKKYAKDLKEGYKNLSKDNENFPLLDEIIGIFIESFSVSMKYELFSPEFYFQASLEDLVKEFNKKNKKIKKDLPSQRKSAAAAAKIGALEVSEDVNKSLKQLLLEHRNSVEEAKKEAASLISSQEDFSKEYDSVLEEKTNLLQKNEILSQGKEDYSKKISSLLQEKERLSGVVNELKAEIKNKLDNSPEVAQELRQSLNLANNINQENSDKLSRQENELKALREKNQALQEKLDKSLKKNENIKRGNDKEIEKLQSENSSLGDEIFSLRHAINNLKENLKKSDELIENYKLENEKLQDNLNNESLQNNLLNDKLREYRDNNKSLSTQNEDLLKENKHLQTILENHKESGNNNFKKQVKNLKDEIKALQEQLGDEENISASLRGLEAENRNIKDDKERLKRTVASLQKNNHELNALNKKISKESQELKKELKKQFEENKSLNQKLQEDEIDRRALAATFKENEELNEKLKNFENWQQVVEEVAATFEKNKELNEKLQKLEEAKKRREALESFGLDEKSSQINNLKKEIDELQEILKSSQERFEKYSKHISKSLGKPDGNKAQKVMDFYDHRLIQVFGLQKIIQDIKTDYKESQEVMESGAIRDKNIAIRVDEVIKKHAPFDIIDSNIASSKAYAGRNYLPWYELLEVGLQANKSCFDDQKMDRIEEIKKSFQNVQEDGGHEEKYQLLIENINELLQNQVLPRNIAVNQVQKLNNFNNIRS